VDLGTDQGVDSDALAAASALRRRIMQANRRRDTRPEMALRSALHRAGLRYRCDFRIDMPAGRVRPDIVFTRKRVAVFVDGCYWHRCPEHGSQPKTNPAYWSQKFERNVARDARNTAWLTDAGWIVVRVWEHEGIAAAVAKVREALDIAST
jgi:DNA mismatch endonuclease (patch repair protein)